MNEKIKEIKEIEFSQPDDKDMILDGYTIVTTEQIIKIGIDSAGQCCEYSGYFCSEDNIEDFIGSEIKHIYLTDESLNSEKFPEYIKDKMSNIEYRYNTVAIFVNIFTSSGTLQFTVYNDHNGHYGHKIIIISEDLVYKTKL